VIDWIEQTLATNYMRKSGEIKAADFKRDTRSIREFSDALITEIGFPACDASAKDAAFLSLKFSPWIVRNKRGDGSTVDNPVDGRQKTFHPTNFRFTIEGLLPPQAKVQKVEALTVKQTTVRDNIGEGRGYDVEPGKLEYPNLKIVVDGSYRAKFKAWLDALEAGKQEKRSGQLVYLDQTRQAALLSLTFDGLGIFQISSDDGADAGAQSSTGKGSTITVEMYVEHIKICTDCNKK